VVAVRRWSIMVVAGSNCHAATASATSSVFHGSLSREGTVGHTEAPSDLVVRASAGGFDRERPLSDVSRASADTCRGRRRNSKDACDVAATEVPSHRVGVLTKRRPSPWSSVRVCAPVSGYIL